LLVLLPPSETKRDGGVEGSRLDLATLRYPELGKQRRASLKAVRALARDLQASIAALGLGPTQHHEARKNRVIGTSPTMAAVDRYTGVLYDALDAGSLAAPARDWLGRSTIVHSAILGPIGALDPIPDYRLSHNSRLPGLTLRLLWAAAAARSLGREDELILDARSEAYAALGPAPVRDGSVFLRVVTDEGESPRRALNHFNKHAKGELTRALAQQSPEIESVAQLIEWARSTGFVLERSDSRTKHGQAELVLVTRATQAPR
jgi:cytoplasmic iron level regulating protein YaaA (DUF328/UPF0246 family)